MENKLSKGVSQQQLSLATQMYCENPNIRIVCAEKLDVIKGERDFYGNIVKEDNFYAIVETYDARWVLVHVLEGYKNTWIQSLGKVNEYLQFARVFIDEATEASQSPTATKIPLGKAESKIDSMFGHNDGTSTKVQDRLVLEFAHDNILGDASTFRRHLYEHPNIQNLNYGGFDWDALQMHRNLGPGDKDYWYDNLDKGDRLRLVDAIVNPDSPFFTTATLRTLVKEYYIGLLENNWWKAMGFEEGKLEVMRLKRKDLMVRRFAMAKAKVQLQQAKANTPTMESESTPTK